jgi:lipopolysaccharide export system protein LptA
MLKRGQDEVRGSYISYDSNTEFFQVDGAAPKTASGKPGDGRVRVILQPKAKEGGASAPAVSLRSDAGAEVKRGDAGAGGK